MKFWVISDTHFNHDNLIEYCARPKDHGDRLKRALFTIPDTDTLIHLGDVCIGGDA